MMISNVYLICISGMQYPHYGMILVPIVIVPIAGMFSYIAEYSGNQPIGTYLFSGYLILTVVWNNWSSLINSTWITYNTRNEESISQNVKTMAEIIQKNTSSEDRISVYGNLDIVYVVSERSHATRYSYQFPIGSVYPAIRVDYMMQLREEKPLIIVVQKGHYDSDIKEFFNNECYELIWAENNELINEGNSIHMKVPKQ